MPPSAQGKTDSVEEERATELEDQQILRFGNTIAANVRLLEERFNRGVVEQKIDVNLPPQSDPGPVPMSSTPPFLRQGPAPAASQLDQWLQTAKGTESRRPGTPTSEVQERRLAAEVYEDVKLRGETKMSGSIPLDRSTSDRGTSNRGTGRPASSGISTSSPSGEGGRLPSMPRPPVIIQLGKLPPFVGINDLFAQMESAAAARRGRAPGDSLPGYLEPGLLSIYWTDTCPVAATVPYFAVKDFLGALNGARALQSAGAIVSRLLRKRLARILEFPLVDVTAPEGGTVSIRA